MTIRRIYCDKINVVDEGTQAERIEQRVRFAFLKNCQSGSTNHRENVHSEMLEHR